MAHRHALRFVGVGVLVLVLPVSVRAAVQAKPYPRYPAWWLRQAACIEHFESRGDPRATGAGNYGAFQFTLGTWESVGGSGDPRAASLAEQRYRAWLVWKRDGGSWREWSTAGLCGLT